MASADFNAAKHELRRMRVEHVRSLSRSLSLTDGAVEWLLHPGKPKDGPAISLMDHHRTQGGTFAVSGVSGSGFQGNPTFDQGDMITDAYKRALCGDKHVGVLNMANAKKPGGGFLGGARAQEEQLCHRSNLFPRLKLHKYFNGENYIAKGTCLVTRNVDILRDGKDTMFEDVRMQAKLTVLSAAATRYASIEAAKSDKDLEKDLIRTWKAVLSGANAAGVQVLIVSALGCGAFNNPPASVGSALAKALAQCDPGVLQEVRVVIFEDHNSGGVNFLSFKEGYAAQDLRKRKRAEEDPPAEQLA